MSKLWYVLRIRTGQEEMIKESIARRMRQEGLEHLLGEINIPKQMEFDYEDGKKPKKKDRKIYQGYLFLELDLMVDDKLNDDLYYIIKDVPSVGDFVGPQGQPLPMTEEDVDKMLDRQPEPVIDATGETELDVVVPFSIADRVTVTEGGFKNCEGEIEKILDRGMVRVNIMIFGRKTPTDIEFTKLEKID